MGAQELRDAANVLRERAEKATPGPWRDSSTEDGVRFGALVADQRHPDRRLGGGWDWDDAYGGCLVGESLMGGDRSFIATMHPGVGLALADLLESTADGLERRGITAHVKHAEATAIVLARLILGGAA